MRPILRDSFDFEKLIKKGCIYVDKTKYLYDLITGVDSYIFLSRPRRFGKSLMVDTLFHIFNSDRELFKGLLIDKENYDWRKYPIFRINFGDCNDVKNSKELRAWLNFRLDAFAKEHDINVKKVPYSAKFSTILSYFTSKNPLVILVDEYDKLLSSNVELEASVLNNLRDTLRGFYEVIKNNPSCIKFCFITGVTKFSKLSIFSSMNNLTDISALKAYDCVLGYSQEELEKNFIDYIQQGIEKSRLDRERYLALLKENYDGYVFGPNCRSVYNPISIGNFFSPILGDGLRFENFWAETGGMTKLLADVARKVKFDISKDINQSIRKSSIMSLDIVEMTKLQVDKFSFISLLFQTGYLTIKKAEYSNNDYYYTLGYPNIEITKTLNEILLPLYLGKSYKLFTESNLYSYFEKGKTKEALEILKSIYASIPYHEFKKGSEYVFHASFHSMLKVLGFSIYSEVATSAGRIDSVIEFDERIYIIEFKLDQAAVKAIEQIKEKKYQVPYLNKGKEIHLVGINFSSKERNIVEYKEEKL